jgi:hypothetical protein
MKHHVRPRSLLFVTASLIPAMLVTPGTAHAESYETWAITQAEACALPIVDSIPPISVEGITRTQIIYNAAVTSCANLAKPLDDTTGEADSALAVALATEESASPSDIMDVLAGTVTLQASSLSDVQYMLALNATDPEVSAGARSDALGVSDGYTVSTSDAQTGAFAYLDAEVATGCLSGCTVPLTTVAGISTREDGGPGDDGNGGNTPSRMSAFSHLPIEWDPAKNHHRADGYGSYYYFKTPYKYRSDVDFYASSMDASVQKYGGNRLKKIYMSAIPGQSMELVEGNPRAVHHYGDSTGSTTINATLSGEITSKSDSSETKGGAGIGISRTWNQYEGSDGGGYLHGGTHFVTWIAGNSAGTTNAKSVDGTTTWSVPSGTAAHWDWEAIATTCSNPC